MQTIWLSHALGSDTPAYAGGDGFHMEPVKRIAAGNSCNTAQISFSNHLGTHVDAPGHFIEDARTVDRYAPEQWVFERPFVFPLVTEGSELITLQHFENADEIPADTNLLLFKTGFEQYRDRDHYWENGPCFTAELANFLRSRCPELRAIGFDSISLMSPKFHDEGVEAHRAFLGNDIRIFEDMSLVALNEKAKLNRVVALPLRYDHADGAPCTIIGWLN